MEEMIIERISQLLKPTGEVLCILITMNGRTYFYDDENDILMAEAAPKST